MTHDEAWVQAQAEKAAFKAWVQAEYDAMTQRVTDDYHDSDPPEDLPDGQEPDFTMGWKKTPDADDPPFEPEPEEE